MRKKKNELLINNELTLKSISGSIDYGWDIASLEWLFNIDEIPFILKWSGKTIKRELLNGRYEKLINDINKNLYTFSYSANVSRFNRIKI